MVEALGICSAGREEKRREQKRNTLTANNDKKTTEVAATLMFKKANIHMIPTEILQRVASGKMHFDSEYVEKAQEELEKRKGKNQ